MNSPLLAYPATATPGADVMNKQATSQYKTEMPERATRHTKISRFFAHNTTMTMSGWCSLAAYRDMRRGRRLAWSEPNTNREALSLITDHPMLTPLGGQAAAIGKIYVDYLHDAQGSGAANEAPEWEQWYSLPLATPCWFTVTGDLPAWSWLCELRSTQQGHYEYRMLAQAMAKAYLKNAPLLAAAFEHVDYSDSGLARLAAEHKNDR